MSSDTKKFLLKLTVFSVPFLVLILPFFVLDPFKIFRSYDDYYAHEYTLLNRDFVTTEIFLKNYDKEKYNAFILGNSKSLAFLTYDWTKHLKNASAFHYDASLESLFGIWRKIKFIDERNMPVQDVLIVLDWWTLEQTTEKEENLRIHHPVVAQTSWGNFYKTFLKTYVSDFFPVKYLDYSIFHKYRSYMSDVLHEAKIRHVPVSNDLLRYTLNEELESDPDKYYAAKKDIFYARKKQRTTSKPIIFEKQQAMLEEMRDIFKRRNTDYKVVISPSYDQSYLHPKDVVRLKEIFGWARVFDYSGINDITDDMRNYYETAHYRPHVGRLIMNEIYSNRGGR